jgi:hypothetical protein
VSGRVAAAPAAAAAAAPVVAAPVDVRELASRSRSFDALGLELPAQVRRRVEALEGEDRAKRRRLTLLGDDAQSIVIPYMYMAHTLALLSEYDGVYIGVIAPQNHCAAS